MKIKEEEKQEKHFDTEMCNLKKNVGFQTEDVHRSHISARYNAEVRSCSDCFGQTAMLANAILPRMFGMIGWAREGFP